MNNNYFFIDGSAFLTDIKKYTDTHKALAGKKFDLVIFTNTFGRHHHLRQFHEGSYRRIVFYFLKDDPRVKQLLLVPNYRKPGLISDLEIKYCGKRVSLNKKAKKWLENNRAPVYVTDSLHKTEKAVDTQICCDALALLSLNKLDRLFIYSNDYDFVPLCRTIKTLGCNINLIKLTDSKINQDLVAEFDAFFSFSNEEIYRFFGIEYKSSSSANTD